ncbi:MAG: hypothetical protein JWQ44_1065, partial [Chthoniobacter sp.]|nr:hypothetical protein [Chthoniobacter sp.]
VFELWCKHRHLLRHGWLGLEKEGDVEQFYSDYPRLGCSFLTFVATYCGYDGPILAEPFKRRMSVIRDLKHDRSATPPVA